MSRRALELHRKFSQLECDAKGWAMGLRYGMGEKRRSAHLTRTSSRRAGRRASWLRDAAMLRLLQDGAVIDGRVVSGGKITGVAVQVYDDVPLRIAGGNR